MARRPLLKPLIATLAALPLAASAASFDTGDEGWTTVDGGNQTWQATGGNGGGWLQVVDADDRDFRLLAPASWLGNWSAYAGGTLSFDAKNINHDTPDWAPFGEVVITGSAGSATLDMVPAGNPPADGQWHRYSVVLAPAAGWSGTPLATVLADVTSLSIKGEFHAGVTETVGIDNIQVAAVPEPQSALLLAAGLGLLAGLRRRR
jgi:Laminin B (Domain IV)/PEP-CTERM motif